jgi:hypothetical protein
MAARPPGTKISTSTGRIGMAGIKKEKSTTAKKKLNFSQPVPIALL